MTLLVNSSSYRLLSVSGASLLPVCIKFQKSNVGGLGYRPMTLGILAQTCCQLLVTVK